jgi:hypothetical protein
MWYTRNPAARHCGAAHKSGRVGTAERRLGQIEAPGTAIPHERLQALGRLAPRQPPRLC